MIVKKIDALVFKETDWGQGNALLDVEKMIYIEGHYVNMHIHREKIGEGSKSFGFEIYFYKKADFSESHYNSRYYKDCKGVPQKYWKHVNEMIKAHEEHFGPIEDSEAC